MTEDRDVANHYGIRNAFPETWPEELDESDTEIEEYSATATVKPKRRSARYSALGRSGSKGLAAGSYRAGGGGDNVAMKDEADPLGSSDSVMYILKKRGIPVEDDMRLRNRFLLSSTSFSPALFLSQAHQDASAEDLLEGLRFLSRSIDQKSASLKVLVEANFERFVRAKATIDSVYTEMRNQGAPKSRPQSHRASGQYRYSLAGAAPPQQATGSAKKTALTKESEYGVKGIRNPLVEASVKAEELWGPALSGRDREQSLYTVVNHVERNRSVFEIGGNISKAIKQQDFDKIFEDYRRAKTLTNEARSIADRAATERRQLTDAESQTILGTGRMWSDVEHQVEAFKRDLWHRLSNVHTFSRHITPAGPVEEHMELIGALLELGVEDNPVWVWLLSSYDLLKTKITAFCERSKVEIEILRRRLSAGDKPTSQAMTAFLRVSSRDGADSKERLDIDQIIELWECIQTFLTKLLSIQTGLLGEVIEFWETAQSFMNGSKQKMLPAGFEGESRKHHHLSSEGVRQLQEGIIGIVDLIRENVLSLFTEPPIEDISLLFSPIPPSPGTPVSHITPTESRFKLDPKNIPPPSPKRGEAWEEFAFWPPHSNSLSGVHYLSQFLILIGTAASEMAALSPITAGSSSYDHLKNLVSIARERSVRVACATWNKDAENCKLLEDWTRDPERRELTKMPGLFVVFESAVLAGMQKILYISEAMSKAGSVDVVTPPPAKLLQMVRSQFVTSVYKALSGLVENAERPVKSNEEDRWVLTESIVPTKSIDSASIMPTSEGIDAKNRNIRMLLTLSNLKAFQTDFVPQLVSNFETAFSVKLTDEAKTIRDVLGQIDDRLFQSYTKPTSVALDATIQNGIKSPDWVPSTNRPEQVRPYVYSTMLALVLVHTEISTTIPISSTTPSPVAHPLLTSVLTHLVTKISTSLLTAFQSRPKYTLPALMQATLDTEFIAQTMSQYVTEEASSIQSQIYLELDRRTNNEARTKLQAELGEMRGILKRLRERTKGEFACFRKVRPSAGTKGGM
ncbi:putative exocyst complex component Sec5 [Talaromyces proteolyticus]|uniref:Exocyst complex component SEC5 n=1 Tax=Talaromyces proteolyticus TaxID=1131652 RepID=A0AAD4KTC1_9EURO|nr:putative exocyst complex component Sec5 [Talaromyces proteolyticus]KAH8698425.1 putative exocyst complex component Sec5 [Talaromyces proteolyticus]